jgi:DNA (cytosine-5)-methyltransferase 1
VRSDLVEMGYAVGAIPIEAASADADHFRDRYWFVADLHSSWELQSEGGKPAQRGWAAHSGLRMLEHASGLGWGEGWTEHEFRRRGLSASVASIDGRQYFECPDGKWRRLPPPGVRWLGNGIPARVAKLRALGNAIDPRPGAEFIRAYLECWP